jgi:hypothetical protein
MFGSTELKMVRQGVVGVVGANLVFRPALDMHQFTDKWGKCKR